MSGNGRSKANGATGKGHSDHGAAVAVAVADEMPPLAETARQDGGGGVASAVFPTPGR